MTGGIIKQLLTGRDGETYAPARVYWCVASITHIALTAYGALILKDPSVITAFADGAGIILGGGGVGVWLTRKTEPEQ
jgi:hypothetical protein